MTSIFRAFVLVLFVTVAGCASGHYGCPAPNGVTCMTATQVYDATEHEERVVGTKNGRPVETPSPSPADVGPYGTDLAPAPAHGKATGAVVVEKGALSFADETLAGRAYPVGEMPEAVPVRTPAKVMRIWISPWQDQSGDLHMAGHVFTEIEPRRWSVGEPGGNPAPQLELLQPLNPPTTSTAQRSDASPAKSPAPAERGG